METLLQQFENKYTGQTGVGNTTANMGQCVGLVSLWQDVLGVPHEYGNAKDLLADANTSFFSVTQNDPTSSTQFPVPGDIMVWGDTWGNGVGHCAIIVTANGTSFTSFEQNDATGVDPNGACEVLSHDYSGVLGWLHFTGTLPAITSGNMFTLPSGAQVDLSNAASMQVCATIWDAVVNLKQYVSLASVNSICTTLGIATGSTADAINATITGLQNQLNTANTNNGIATKQVTVLEGQNQVLTNTNESLTTQLTTAQQANTDPQSKLTWQSLYIQAEANYQKTLGLLNIANTTITQLQKQQPVVTKPQGFFGKLQFLFS